jgi:hypothetical protein
MKIILKFLNLTIDLQRRDSLQEPIDDLLSPNDLFEPKKNVSLALENSFLSNGVYQVHKGVVSAHPEIFKVKMLAKKNVKTISTMSSSNYDNSDNSSNLGGKNCFRVPRRKFYERDILTE